MYNNRDDLDLDEDGCYICDQEAPKVKGRFGLAWVSESPDCPCPVPIGWQVEFLDTPSKVEQKCQEMVKWINCPPLPRCEPCPPEELCCGTQNKCCKCQPKKERGKEKKKCCCCQDQGKRKKWCAPTGPPCSCKSKRS